MNPFKLKGKSNPSVGNGSEEDEEGLKHTYNYLVVDVWDILLDKYLDPLDKLSVLEAFPQLENEFHNRLMEWKAVAVLPIIFSSLFVKISIRRRGFSKWDSGLLRRLYLNCRQLSSSSCKALDKLVDDYWEKHLAPPLCLAKITVQYDIMSGIWHRNFIQKIESRPVNRRCPILSRELDLYFSNLPIANQDETKPLRSEVIKLVKIVGEHTRGLSLLVELFHGHTIKQPSRFCKNVLSLTPRLKSLNLKLLTSNIEDRRGIRSKEPMVLPPIPHLQKLCIVDLPVGIKLKIRHLFPQLKIFHLHVGYWKETYNVGRVFPSLKELHLERIQLRSDKDFLVRLLSNVAISPRLEKIHFSCDKAPGFPSLIERVYALDLCRVGKNLLMWNYPNHQNITANITAGCSRPGIFAFLIDFNFK